MAVTIKNLNLFRSVNIKDSNISKKNMSFYQSLYKYYGKKFNKKRIKIVSHEKILNCYFERFYEPQQVNRMFIVYDRAQYEHKLASLSRYLEYKFKLNFPIQDVCDQNEMSYFIAIKIGLKLAKVRKHKIRVLLISPALWIRKETCNSCSQIAILDILIERPITYKPSDTSIVFLKNISFVNEINLQKKIEYHWKILKKEYFIVRDVSVYVNFDIHYDYHSKMNIRRYNHVICILAELLGEKVWPMGYSLVLYYERSTESLNMMLLKKNEIIN